MMQKSDSFGFPLLDLSASELSEREAGMRRQKIQAKVWCKVLPEITAYAGSVQKMRQSVKQLVRKGVPLESRATAWYYLSGAAKRHESNAGLYADLQMSIKGSAFSLPCLPSIVKDVHSAYIAMGRHKMFCEDGMMQALKRMLTAYIQLDSSLGYFGGVLRFAGMMLLIFGPEREEEAFWTFVCFLQDRLFQWAPGQAQAHIRSQRRVLSALLPRKFPKLDQVFRQSSLDPTCMVGEWMSTAFVGFLPPETVVRIWDCVIVEGPKVIIRVSLALLKVFGSSAARSTPDMMRYVMSSRLARGYDADSLLLTAFNGIGALRSTEIMSLLKAAEQEDDSAKLTTQVSRNL